jgi:hypothetical protein
MTDTKHTNIEAALRRGAKIHAFLSGGGLRVVRVEDDLGRLIGYGEHPYIGEALQHCDDDIAAGGRDYYEVYGKLHPHYLTGDSTPNSPLDAWVRKGSTFDVIAGEGGFVATMAGYANHEPPEGYLARCIAGETLEWEARGYRYRMTPSRFPGNGEPCASTSILSAPEGRNGADPWMWPTEQTATAPTLIEALDAALNAEAVEVPRRY